MLHEFAALYTALPEICAVPTLLKSLYRVLTSSEASIQRLVLRVLRFLCESSEDFKTRTIYNKQLLARLPICLASGDSEVISWSLYLIHDIAKSGKMHLITLEVIVLKALIIICFWPDDVLFMAKNVNDFVLDIGS